MVCVGIVGIGFMGMIHYLAYQKVRGAKVAAIATRDAKRRAGDWRGIQGNFGPPGEQMDLSAVRKYADWAELLEDPAIDLVDVCLPPAMHAEVAIAALAAGKHVLVEKPITLDAATARRMTQAATRSGKLLMVAHVLPFFAEYAAVRKLVESGKYGALIGGHFKRIISDPAWIKDFFNPTTVGGPLVDLHIHDAHFIRMLAGMPEAVFSTGRMRGEVVEFFTSQFLYGPRNLALTAAGGVIGQQGRSFTHGFEIFLEKATLIYDFAVMEGQPTVSMPLTLLAPGGGAKQVKLSEVDAFAAELTEATRAARTGVASPVLAANLALDALVLCQRQAQSVAAKKIVRV